LRRLNRAQIQEILERNISLYREEEHFATYLIELALYLMEYEYDWAESGAAPPALRGADGAQTPANGAAPSNGAQKPVHATPVHHLTPTPQFTPYNPKLDEPHPPAEKRTTTDGDASTHTPVQNLTPPLAFRRTPKHGASSGRPAADSWPRQALGQARTLTAITPPEEDGRDTPPPGGGRRFVSMKLKSGERKVGDKGETSCPYCGTDLGDASQCPSCKNLVR
jgi:hypothetical protein